MGRVTPKSVPFCCSCPANVLRLFSFSFFFLFFFIGRLLFTGRPHPLLAFISESFFSPLMAAVVRSFLSPPRRGVFSSGVLFFRLKRVIFSSLARLSPFLFLSSLSLPRLRRSTLWSLSRGHKRRVRLCLAVSSYQRRPRGRHASNSAPFLVDSFGFSCLVLCMPSTHPLQD